MDNRLIEQIQSIRLDEKGSKQTMVPLPYALDALSPTISKEALTLHYEKHYAGYVKKLNELIEGTNLEGLELTDIVLKTADMPTKKEIFHNAGQALNHVFFWSSLTPKGGGEPPEVLKRMIIDSFGSVAACKKEIVEVGVSQFGSGWVWVVLSGKKLEVVKTCTAGNPITEEKTPLLCIDLWEHSYYLQYQNRREEYIKAVLENVWNWYFGLNNLGKR